MREQPLGGGVRDGAFEGLQIKITPRECRETFSELFELKIRTNHFVLVEMSYAFSKSELFFGLI